MKTKLPDNFIERMARMEDLPEIHRLEQKTSLHYLGVPGMSLERIQNEYQSPGFDPTKSVKLIMDQEGSLVALVEVWDETDPPVHPAIWMTVDHDYTGLGLEDYLLAWGEERARHVLDRVDPELKVALWAYISSEVDSNHQALRKAGFTVIRHGFQMRIEMEEIPPVPTWPEGIRLKLYNPKQDARLSLIHI